MNADIKTFRRALCEEARRLDVAASEPCLDALCLHYELIVKWNPRVRLIADIEPGRAARELFADSLVLARFIDRAEASAIEAGPTGKSKVGARAARRIVDIGAGSGVAGVPPKILRPELEAVFIEATAKKVSFLKMLVRELDLSHTGVICGRAERLAHEKDFREQFDIALCRAVAPPAVTCELAIPFLKKGGSFIAQTAVPSKGNTHDETLKSLRAAAGPLGATIDISTTYSIAGPQKKRSLIRIKKISTTPPQYPRNAQTMRKKPLA